jgi:ParB-like nuclease domain
MPKRQVWIADIDFDGSPKVRAVINTEAVEDYAEKFKSGESLDRDPITLFENEGEKYLLIGDGRHRLEALKKLGRKQVLCEVRPGGIDEAGRFALASNRTHGLRRTNLDKRACVVFVLGQWPEKSLRETAELAGVSHNFVSEIRAESVKHTDRGVSSDDSKPKASAVPKSKKGKSGKSKTATEAVPPPPDGEPPEEESKPEKPKVPVDKVGWQLTKESMPFWERGPEVQEMLTAISHAKATLEKAQDANDPMYQEVNFSNCINRLSDAWIDLKRALPYALCTLCQGHNIERCTFCYGRGVISQFKWEQTANKPTVKMRLQQLQALASA